MGWMDVSSYKRPLRTLSYARRLKHMRPGVKGMKFRGKSVKVLLEKDGRTLKILSAPPNLIAEIKAADTFKIDDGRLQPVIRKPFRKPTPAAKPVTAKIIPPAPKPEQPVEPAPKPAPKPVKEPAKVTTTLTEADRKKAMLVPVPDKGIIPTPYIDWGDIPEHCKVTDIAYMDYSSPTAPKGMLPELREMFKRSRRYQNTAPVNVLIQGWKGSGKSELIKAFAEDTGLPYWGVMGQEGIRAEELLGHKELVADGQGGTRSVWIDGLIPKAVRAGGILHFDEPNVIEPAILMRLDELMDNKRQLNMEDYNGEVIKAHPDLFIIFSMNPPTFEGVKPLPPPILSRLTKKYPLNYPPQEVEMAILKYKMNLSDSEFKVPAPAHGGTPTGKFAKDIVEFMKVVDGLRQEQDISYTPSMRETQGFVQDLREGDDFTTAFNRNVRNLYWGDEAAKIDQALFGARRTTR